MLLGRRQAVAEQVLETPSDPWLYRLQIHVDDVNPYVTAGTRTLSQLQSLVVINILLAPNPPKSRDWKLLKRSEGILSTKPC